MAKKKPIEHGGGTLLTWFDPQPGEVCEYQAIKKRGRGYIDNPCGDPARVIMIFRDHEPTIAGGVPRSSAREIRLCPLHLFRITNECMSMLKEFVK